MDYVDATWALVREINGVKAKDVLCTSWCKVLHERRPVARYRSSVQYWGIMYDLDIGWRESGRVRQQGQPGKQGQHVA